MTSKQKQLLDFIIRWQAEKGTTPSYDEIAEGLGVKTKSTVFNIMKKLEEQEYISRVPGSHRAIKVSINKLAEDNCNLRKFLEGFNALDVAKENEKLKELLRECRLIMILCRETDLVDAIDNVLGEEQWKA